MSKKVIFMFVLLLVVSAFFFAQYGAVIDTGYAKSTPRVVGTDCPDDHVCYWAVQKQTGNKMCRANTNDAWSWVEPKEQCGGDGDSKKAKDPTSTDEPVVVVVPTKTQQPTKTQPAKLDDPVAATKTKRPGGDNDKRPTATLTLTPVATYVTGSDPNMICNWCALASTDVAAQERQASAQETIAAELSK